MDGYSPAHWIPRLAAICNLHGSTIGGIKDFESDLGQAN